MSHDATKGAILSALNTPNTPVIALTGDWGCGKTYLWKEVIAKELNEKNLFTPIYVSTTGISSIDELKTTCSARMLSLLSSIKLSKKIYGYINQYIDKVSKIIPSTIQSNIAQASL
ncbi:MAG: P-loop NTPase fold protein [Candidatus Thiodiazotropha sp. L084R]